MKRVIFILCIFTLIHFSGHAQGFAFYQQGLKLENNAEIQVSVYTEENDGTVAEPDMQAYFESNLELRNESQSTMNGVMTQEVLTAPKFGYLSFCFGNCVITNSFYTLETSVAPTNTTALHLSYFVPVTQYETVKAKYTVYDKLDPSNAQVLTITYTYTNQTAVPTTEQDALLKVQQRGQQLEVSMDSEQYTHGIIRLYNMAGVEVFAKTLLSSGDIARTTCLSKGCYVVALYEGNLIVARKKVLVR